MTPLEFIPAIARQKPTNQDACPFCNLASLEKIIDQTDDFLWLDNKYPTIKDTYQTLVIESQDHLGDVSNYSYDYNRRLFNYLWDCFDKLQATGAYQSVVMFRNFGPRSGGSLRHPHTQIIGFDHVDAYEQLEETNFLGKELLAETISSPKITLSSQPLIGFSEFNVLVSRRQSLAKLADGVKELVGYLMTAYFNGRCDSYNLFFYEQPGKFICKVVPRFIASPYYIGYKLPQVDDAARQTEVKAEFLAYRAQLRKDLLDEEA